jgi:hypothetical protein
MSYKPDEKDWMAYLYGELEGAEKEKFDHYLSAHPEGRLQLEKYQNLRRLLPAVGDKEVIAPPLFITDQKGKSAGRHFWHTPSFRTITSIAASLLVLILAGRLTGTRLTVSDHEFRLTFGEAPMKRMVEQEPARSALSPEEVQQMINASMAKNNEIVQGSLEETQQELEASIRKNLALNAGRMDQIVREASSASQQQIRQYVDGIRTENTQQVKDYFQLTSTEQKKYIENLLVDFAKYLQQQRNDDLQLVQTRLNSLEQDTDLFRQETEQILSSIITTVANPGTGEIRN